MLELSYMLAEDCTFALIYLVSRLRDSQRFMQKHLERLMYDIGEYILKTYDRYEE